MIFTTPSTFGTIGIAVAPGELLIVMPVVAEAVFCDERVGMIDCGDPDENNTGGSGSRAEWTWPGSVIVWLCWPTSAVVCVWLWLPFAQVAPTPVKAVPHPVPAAVNLLAAPVDVP